MSSRTLPLPKVVGGRVRLSTEHCQSFFINATSKLVTKLQATRDCNPVEDFCANFLNLTRLNYRMVSPQKPRSRSLRKQLLI